MNEDKLITVLKALEVSSVSAMITHSSLPKRDPSSFIGAHHLLERSAIDSVFLPQKMNESFNEGGGMSHIFPRFGRGRHESSASRGRI